MENLHFTSIQTTEPGGTRQEEGSRHDLETIDVFVTTVNRRAHTLVDRQRGRRAGGGGGGFAEFAALSTAADFWCECVMGQPGGGQSRRREQSMLAISCSLRAGQRGGGIAAIPGTIVIDKS